MSALLRWRLDEQPRSVGHTLVNCGSWLASDGGLAAAASPKDVPHSNCGSEPARDGVLTAAASLKDVPHSNCRSEPARDGVLTAAASLKDVPHSNCGSWPASEGGLTAAASLKDIPHSNCRSEPARDGGLTAAASLKDVPHSNCRSEPARDGGLAADTFSAGVHIHSCGNGLLWFRSYSESLLSNARNAGPAKRNQKVLPHHTAPRWGSVFPHSGIASGARRDRPSMAVRG